MRILERINSAQAPSFAFELMGSGSLRDMLETCETLLPFKPLWFNVTSHCSDPVLVCNAIENHFRTPAVGHVICQDVTCDEVDAYVEELHTCGVENLLCLQGEPTDVKRRLPYGATSNRFASDLVKQVSYSAYNFCIGVAGYPEKHFEAPDIETDIANLKKKVDAGAHYILTQMFFDNSDFFTFVERCRAAGIQAPIIPGLRILHSLEQIEMVERRFHVRVPASLREAMASDPVVAGREWAICQARELFKSGFPIVHFFVINDRDTVKEVVAGLTTL